MSLPESAPPSAFLAAPPRLRPAAEAVVETSWPEAAENTLVSAVAPAGSRAVVYLRVSSKGQVNTDYDPEGISIPAQRLSCERKADQLGLSIVAEYVEAGISGTEMTKRVEFQRMLERIRRDKDVDYVIVYKLSRFARNRTDDAIVMADLQKRGVTLISATEQIDATPVGQLMHGILSAFNEYRSREDGADIAYKMGQKAKSGGTLGRAPIGYLNVTDTSEGRKINTVKVDPERASFVKLAFELYADGNHTFQDIADELTDRGLLTRATARRPAGPVSDSKIQSMLRDRYYLGEISYKDEWHSGRHEALIDEELFNRVQRLVHSRSTAGERRRRHPHYLKGTVWCGHCYLEHQTDRRLLLQHTVTRADREYIYLFCKGNQDASCDAPYSSIDRVEDAVTEHYKTIRFHPDFIAEVNDRLESVVADQQGAKLLRQKQLRARLSGLAAKEDNLLDLAADGSLPQERIRHRLREIARERESIEGQLGGVDADLQVASSHISAFLTLLENPYELYSAATEEVRRELNQTIFGRVYIVNDQVVGDVVNSPLREMLATQRGWEHYSATTSTDASEDVAFRELRRHSPLRKETASEGGLSLLSDEAFCRSLLHGICLDGDSSNALLVGPEGLEPPASSV